MNCTEIIKKMLDVHGREIKLTIGSTTHTSKAIIQLMRYKNKMYIDLPSSEIGVRDTGCFLYIGSPEFDLTDRWGNVSIVLDNSKYLVKRAQIIYCGSSPLYVWAVLYRACKDGTYENDQ